MDPIVGFGLLMDANGLPVGMSVFPGNTYEVATLEPAIRDLKESYGLGRLIVVADKGLNSSDNINRIVNNGDGFVVSQPLRGSKGMRYRARVFYNNGYIENADGIHLFFRYSRNKLSLSQIIFHVNNFLRNSKQTIFNPNQLCFDSIFPAHCL